MFVLVGFGVILLLDKIAKKLSMNITNRRKIFHFVPVGTILLMENSDWVLAGFGI